MKSKAFSDFSGDSIHEDRTFEIVSGVEISQKALGTLFTVGRTQNHTFTTWLVDGVAQMVGNIDKLTVGIPKLSRRSGE